MGLISNFLNALIEPTKENRANLKGSIGESQAALGLFLFLNSDYTVLHNVTIPTPKGTTQIDHVVFSRFGIFVIETKNIQGTIYGDEKQAKWTTFLGGKKFQFTNPVLQNRAHIKALSTTTELPEEKFHSLIFFWSDNCRFKTPMPDNVRREGLCSFIKKHTNTILSESELTAALTKTKINRLSVSKETDQTHKANLKERFQTLHKEGDTCPRCEGILKTRKAKTTGKTFLGCSNFPTCRHTEIPQTPETPQ